MSTPHHPVMPAGYCACAACKPIDLPASTPQVPLSRRGLMRRALAGVAAGLIPAAALQFPFAQTARAQSTMTPEQALQALSDGNQRFISGKLASFDEDLTILKQQTVDKQEPFVAVLSCADSRVPVELIFDQSIGHVFVTRVAGNISTAEMISSLEYGVAVLGAKAIMVLGHSDCGAV